MSQNKTQNVDPSSAEFQEGVEAGLNSAEDTKNWQAGNDLGQALKDEGENKACDSSAKESSTPLFRTAGSTSNHGNAQDEKDETEE